MILTSYYDITIILDIQEIRSCWLSFKMNTSQVHLLYNYSFGVQSLTYSLSHLQAIWLYINDFFHSL